MGRRCREVIAASFVGPKTYRISVGTWRWTDSLQLERDWCFAKSMTYESFLWFVKLLILLKGVVSGYMVLGSV